MLQNIWLIRIFIISKNFYSSLIPGQGSMSFNLEEYLLDDDEKDAAA